MRKRALEILRWRFGTWMKPDLVLRRAMTMFARLVAAKQLHFCVQGTSRRRLAKALKSRAQQMQLGKIQIPLGSEIMKAPTSVAQQMQLGMILVPLGIGLSHGMDMVRLGHGMSVMHL